jgi:hypothetical protein
VAKALRLAILESIAAASVGCGGSIIEVSPDTVQPGESTCALASTTSVGGDSCGGQDFPLNGTFASCGVTDAGSGPALEAALPASQCAMICPPTGSGKTAISCYIADSSGYSANAMQIHCSYYGPCATGRRPQGLAHSAPSRGPSATARTLAQMAHLEAASVLAFAQLARELEDHGAPRGLREGARRSMRDEVRHASVVRGLAEQEGGVVPEVEAARPGPRSLEEMAVENAVEGCVRETFGAAVAMIQARSARDSRVRRAMRRIAYDEARHAELAWAVARWVDARLDAAARRRVRQARTQAVAALVREAATEPDEMLAHWLGIPRASQARRVLAGLSASLWSDAAA